MGKSMNQNRVKRIIPHRYPMLFVDEVLSLEDGRIETLLWLDPKWPLFAGHFPGSPVFPGVLAAEAMAQAADILLLSRPEYAGREPLLVGLDQVKFKQRLSPGDVVMVEASILSEKKEKAVAFCQARVMKNGTEAVEGTVILAMR